MFVLVLTYVSLLYADLTQSIEHLPPDVQNSLGIRFGREAIPHAYPWLVSIQMEYTTNHFMHQAGGTLINSKQVVTAAHVCREVVKREGVRFRCLFGKHDVSQTEEGELVIGVKAVSCYKHFNYDKFLHDICVIQLQSEVPAFTSRISPATLADSESSLPRSCILAGWGSDGYWPVTPKLQEMTVSLMDISVCQKLDPLFPKIDICSQDKPYPKHGDSGGPLMCKFNGQLKVVGVHSYLVKKKAGDMRCAAHTDIRLYGDFIAKPPKDPKYCLGGRPTCSGPNCIWNIQNQSPIFRLTAPFEFWHFHIIFILTERNQRIMSGVLRKERGMCWINMGQIRLHFAIPHPARMQSTECIFGMRYEEIADGEILLSSDRSTPQCNDGFRIIPFSVGLIFMDCSMWMRLLS
ncbi:chymotrypsin-C-like [Paramacrobiotus metropolitanus]|uniref:chymotrypsin-C-like n=1 Tax=Paramacrobiotus metropolitanus TaxID=2943436 RepID=UPI0024462A76|nr:chymotrypsin-C-like [Paramacrobiotus metropolitanus]